MTTKQNIQTGRTATAYDIAQLIAQGLAGQRSAYGSIDQWSGREYAAIMSAAQELVTLYRDDLVADELIARVGRSMLDIRPAKRN